MLKKCGPSRKPTSGRWSQRIPLRRQLRVDPLEVGRSHDDRPSPAGRVARASDREAQLVEQLDQQRRLLDRARADPLDADLLDHVVARGRRVERGHVRRAGQKAPGALGVLLLGLEVERPRVGLPTREGGLERAGQVGTDVQPSRAGASAEPLDRAADREVDAQSGHVERHRSDRLVRVEHDVGAVLVRRLDDRLDVLDLTRLEEHVRDRDEQRPLVDRLHDALVVGRNHDVGPSLGLVQVANRGEVALLVDDPATGAGEVEAREHDRLGDRHVLVHRHRSRRRADQAGDLVADRQRHLPPSLAPGADAAGLPVVRVVEHTSLGRRRHGTERVVDQVRGLREDREAIAVFGELGHRPRV